MFRYLLAVIILLANGALAGEQLLYAHRIGKLTTISACHVELKTCEKVFSDVGATMRLMTRGGGDIESSTLIQSAGSKIFAVGTSGDSKVGALYELSADKSNRFRKITDVLSESPLDLIAVDRTGKKINYVASTPDKHNEMRGEYDAPVFHSTNLIVHDTSTGNIINNVMTKKLIGTQDVLYMSWGEDGMFYLEMSRHSETGLYKVDFSKKFKKIPIVLKVLNFVVGPLANGNFLITNEYPTRKFNIVDATGKVLGSIPLQETGWNNKLSRDEVWVAYQTSNDGIWIKNLKTGSETKVVSMNHANNWDEAIGLIGWIDR